MNPQLPGSNVTFTAYVAPQYGTGTPTGTVTFLDGAAKLAQVTLDGSGHAVLATVALAAGSHFIAAAYSGDANFQESSASMTETITLASQTISFGSLSNVTYGAAPIALSATASSGLPVSYTVTGPATLTGTALNPTLTINGAGSVTVTASQAGDGVNWAAAAPVPQTFTVYPTPTISSLSPAFTVAGGTAFTLTVNGTAFSSGSQVYWGSTALATTFVSATQLTAAVTVAEITSAGTTTISVLTSDGSFSNPLVFETDSTATIAPTFTTKTVTVTAGTAATATYAVTLPSTSTDVSVTCLNLPAGASCSHSTAAKAVTITTSSATPVGSYQITVIFTEDLTSTTIAGLPILLLPLLWMRKKLMARGAWSTVCLGVILLAGTIFSTSCGGGSKSTSTTTTTNTTQVTSSGVVTLVVQ